VDDSDDNDQDTEEPVSVPRPHTCKRVKCSPLQRPSNSITYSRLARVDDSDDDVVPSDAVCDEVVQSDGVSGDVLQSDTVNGDVDAVGDDVVKSDGLPFSTIHIS